MASGEESSEDSENFEELYERLQIVMDSLPPKCKEIFILGCIEGLRYKDVSEQLGVSVNTVKTLLSGGLEQLRQQFSDTLLLFFILEKNNF